MENKGAAVLSGHRGALPALVLPISSEASSTVGWGGHRAHTSAPLVTAGASPRGGKEEASIVSSPPLETQCWGGDGPAPAGRPAIRLHPQAHGVPAPPAPGLGAGGEQRVHRASAALQRQGQVAGETSWASVLSPAGRLLLPRVSSAIVFDLGDAVEIAGCPPHLTPGGAVGLRPGCLEDHTSPGQPGTAGSALLCSLFCFHCWGDLRPALSGPD